ncbi:MAG TPA: HlyD family secretion protein, partial [Burkholderiaceae bacterium]|nr:HlyD family secretion protein [Burkholderiaceae bacterium]
MTVIPLNSLWVDANFKEVQLRHLRIGQPAEVRSDLYGGSFIFHGHVKGMSAGTGAAFSLLPAQNATGNWIKVVQRVPVRIALDSKEVAQNPLRVGLSMNVTVDVADQSGRAVADTPRTQGAVASTTVFDSLQRDADAEVASIVAANGGGRIKPTATAQTASAPAVAASGTEKVASAATRRHHKQS